MGFALLLNIYKKYKKKSFLCLLIKKMKSSIINNNSKNFHESGTCNMHEKMVHEHNKLNTRIKRIIPTKPEGKVK